jgi:hypothetical protein
MFINYAFKIAILSQIVKNELFKNYVFKKFKI